MNEFNSETFKSIKREGYFKIIIAIATLISMNSYIALLLFNYLPISNSHSLKIFIFGLILLLFFIWIIFIAIREHFIFKCNFISNYKIIKFHSLIYHKIINWDDVENIEFDVMVAILSYLPYMETRCIILNLKNGKKYYIPLGGYDNIDDFKKYLNKNFSDKILN